jgi:tRNA(fMet)-specific endonuclease VapC
MPGSVLLDTNIVIALFAGDAAVRNHLAQNLQVFLSSTVLGELYYGALKSRRISENVARIDELASSINVLPCDAVTARHYGEIKETLRSHGQPIPENDIWVAAVARQHGLALVTRDEHFKFIQALSLEQW